MSELITKVDIPKSGFKIDYRSTLFFMGSCFSDHIGRKMQRLKFSVCHNPFGVVYNPISISNCIRLLLQKEEFNNDDLNFYNELWFSYSHSTQFSDVDREACLNKINRNFLEAKNAIINADVLVLTLGTSWVYKLKETGEVVANCHKIPSEKFNRFFSSTDNTLENLVSVIKEIRESNQSVKIIFTVSPIRHWKDGAIENQRSKAALILTIAKLQEQLDEIYYFPAYEIFMDELRDYRFYASDMLHPSESGIEYTWNRFCSIYLSDETMSILSQVNSILNKIDHKPLHKNTKGYSKFISTLNMDITNFQKKYPHIIFNDELQ